MSRQRRSALCLVLMTLAAASAGKVPPGTPWTSYLSKPVYSRSLGPPGSPGVATISVPYVPKPSMFPKLVDPRVLIAKKTDMLSNLFGGLGPADYHLDPYPAALSYQSGSPTLPSSSSGNSVNPLVDEIRSVEEEAGLSDEDKLNTFKRGLYGPLNPSVPFPGSGSKSSSGSFGGVESFRRKRGISSQEPKAPPVQLSSAVDKDGSLNFLFGPGNGAATESRGTPPPYPGFGSIAEESESNDDEASYKETEGKSSSIPKEFLPGMFGPMISPMGPMFGPPIDPTMFTAKKSAFLDTLFKNIAATTPTTTTEVPVPKSTIVPPSFWLPTSFPPDPTAYTDKVSTFLNKLFDSLNTSSTTTEAGSKVNYARSVGYDSDAARGTSARSPDLATIIAAKDSIVDSILTELINLKTDMAGTLDDLITYEKSITPPPTSSKSFKSFLGPWAKTAVDPTLPFQQKMLMLGQVFDMLSDLQRNITSKIQPAIQSGIDSSGTSNSAVDPNFQTSGSVEDEPINLTLLDAIKSKLDNLDAPSSFDATPIMPKIGTTKSMRSVPMGATSFWVAYPQSTPLTAKRQTEDDELPRGTQRFAEDNGSRDQYGRTVKMQLYQGHRSLPQGTMESVRAGGGSTSGHQGGGINLLESEDYQGIDAWAAWQDFLRRKYKARGHHHDHH